jgi:hypothetical protein
MLGVMVDLSDLGGSGKRNSPKMKSAADRLAEATKSPFQKSTLERLAEGMKSPFDNLDLGMKTALGGLAGISALEKQMRAYEKAQDRLKDAFAPSPVEKLLDRTSGADTVSRAIEHLEMGRMQRSILDDLPAMSLQELPPNPIFETNDHLEQVAAKIDALLDVQAKQAGLIDLLLKAHVEGGKVQGRMAMWGLAIGLVGVVVAVLAIAL